MQFTAEHLALSDTVKRFVENEINPYSDEWEKAGIFPAHELFKKLGMPAKGTCRSFSPAGRPEPAP